MLIHGFSDHFIHFHLTVLLKQCEAQEGVPTCMKSQLTLNRTFTFISLFTYVVCTIHCILTTAGSWQDWTTRRSPDNRKEMQTAVVWSCFPLIRSGQNHLARQSERGKKARAEGRQRKRQEDNIREWTGLEFGKSQRAVENREKWRKLVAKSSVVPQRPSRLRD